MMIRRTFPILIAALIAGAAGAGENAAAGSGADKARPPGGATGMTGLAGSIAPPPEAPVRKPPAKNHARKANKAAPTR